MEISPITLHRSGITVSAKSVISFLSSCTIFIIIIKLTAFTVQMSQLTVLACLGERRRPIKVFAPPLIAALQTGIRTEFAEFLPRDCSLVFQVQDVNWQGMFVDLVSDQNIVDRCIINVIVVKEPTQPVIPSPLLDPKKMYLRYDQECNGVLPFIIDAFFM